MKNKELLTLFILLFLFPTVVSGDVFRVSNNRPDVRDFYIDETGVSRYTIQAAIDEASDGDTVLLADGTYVGEGNRAIDFKGKAITLTSENGPTASIIDCMGAERGFTFHSEEDQNSVLNGITLRHGNSLGVGGIYIGDSSPTISNCIIESCLGVFGGGGIYIENSCALIESCEIIGNSSGWTGGGVASINANPVFINCLFAENVAGDGGAGVFGDEGGCLTLINSTITGNTASENGQGAGVRVNYGELLGVNVIVYDNVPNEIGFQTATIQYSNVKGGFSGEGNINADPQFATGPSGAYYLSQTAAGQTADSPCINAGNDLAINVCFPINGADVCMDELTTRTDLVSDASQVDMGFHYPSQQSSVMPFEGPTLSCAISMPSQYYRPGDDCYCDLSITNPSQTTYHNVPVFVVLEVNGAYLFAPAFSEVVGFYTENINPGVKEIQVLPQFKWPEGAGTVSGVTWYAVVLTQDYSGMLSDLREFEFGWGL